jgi:hypothetical protein
MIVDYLRLLVEALSRALPALLAQKKGKERRALGVKLYLVYVAINEALIRGELIIQGVEQLVEDDGADSAAARRLQEAIKEQIRCFEHIADLLASWGQVLQLLDGETFASLYLLLHEKIGWLNRLLAIVRSGEYPLLDDAALDRLERALEDSGGTDERNFEEVWGALDELRGLPIPKDSADGSRKSRKEFETYLEHRKPREQLALIRRHLEEMRSALLEQITINDLLLDVGDQGFSRRRDLDQ